MTYSASITTPAVPLDLPVEPVDRQVYRNGMSKLAAAVNIITSVGPDGPVGFTASAVTSVTDSPPTLLVCINKTAQSRPIIRDSNVLCVNTVASPHEDLSMLFAGAGGNKDMAARFAAGEWKTLVTGSPVLVGASVSFDCRVAEVAEIGTHDVLFCEVLAVEESGPPEGLVYFSRKFHRVA
ncbi:flavin reductase [Chthonobacter rhizosphaerae]|uniref:flavin reductase n=1 Tax=Chthonobacter rhizosphaerae TaxID=2735553 RepID=UPI0031B568E3